MMARHSCGNFDFLDMRRRCWNKVTVHPHAFDMELDRFAHELAGFFQRRGRCHAPRKIGNVSAVARRGELEENDVLAHFSPACFSKISRTSGPSPPRGGPRWSRVPGFRAKPAVIDPHLDHREEMRHPSAALHFAHDECLWREPQLFQQALKGGAVADGVEYRIDTQIDDVENARLDGGFQ